MALNYPGPFEYRIKYALTGVAHEQRLSFIAADDYTAPIDFASIMVERRNAADIDAETDIEAWMDLFITQFQAATTISSVEIWKYDPGSFDATFVSAHTPTDTNGTNGGSALLAGYDNYSFRTSEGGVMHVRFMEPVTAFGNCLGYAALSAGRQAIIDTVLDDVNSFVGRDTSYPVAFIQMCPGQHEAIYKRRYR